MRWTSFIWLMAGEWRQNPVNMNLIHWLEFLWTTLNNSNSSASSTFKSTITVQRSILQSNKLYSIFGGTKTVEDWSNDCNKAVNNWSVAGLHHEHLVKWAWDDQKSDNQKIHTRYPAEEICCDIRYCAGISAPHSWSSDHESNHLQSVSFWSKLSPRL